MAKQMEWVSEGEPNGKGPVGETEWHFVIKCRRMSVRRKSGRNAPSRVAPQERDIRSCPSVDVGIGAFCFGKEQSI